LAPATVPPRPPDHGVTVWFTGLPSAGKTTIAGLVVLLSAFRAAMRYAGPREAVLHAIVRKNYGCTHLIVGRDHAGVGSFYGTYAAQEAFDAYDAGELAIEPLRFEHAFFCRRCDGMATSRTCPHPPASHLHLSGTAVRAMLERGELPPPELSRPEVARVLADGYRAASKE
jgi:sulfate adenylyltransferase